MLSEVCSPGRSHTVVEVMKHGWLPRRPSLYYIDMAYCPETLENGIHGKTGHNSRFGDDRTDRLSDQPMGIQ